MHHYLMVKFLMTLKNMACYFYRMNMHHQCMKGKSWGQQETK